VINCDFWGEKFKKGWWLERGLRKRRGSVLSGSRETRGDLDMMILIRL
jgi:hypothetical protein